MSPVHNISDASSEPSESLSLERAIRRMSISCFCEKFGPSVCTVVVVVMEIGRAPRSEVATPDKVQTVQTFSVGIFSFSIPNLKARAIGFLDIVPVSSSALMRSNSTVTHAHL